MLFSVERMIPGRTSYHWDVFILFLLVVFFRITKMCVYAFTHACVCVRERGSMREHVVVPRPEQPQVSLGNWFESGMREELEWEMLPVYETGCEAKSAPYVLIFAWSVFRYHKSTWITSGGLWARWHSEQLYLGVGDYTKFSQRYYENVPHSLLVHSGVLSRGTSI